MWSPEKLELSPPEKRWRMSNKREFTGWNNWRKTEEALHEWNWWSKETQTPGIKRVGGQEKQRQQEGRSDEYLEENGARFKRNSSSVFKWRGENTTKILRYSGRMESKEVEPIMKWFEIDLGKASDWWNSFLRQTRKELGMAPEYLEESGKILGKDLWVRGH